MRGDRNRGVFLHYRNIFPFSSYIIYYSRRVWLNVAAVSCILQQRFQQINVFDVISCLDTKLYWQIRDSRTIYSERKSLVHPSDSQIPVLKGTAGTDLIKAFRAGVKIR